MEQPDEDQPRKKAQRPD